MSSRSDERARRTERRQTEASRPTPPGAGMRAVVVHEQNPRGAMTLRGCRANATYQVVGYATPDIRSTAGRLERGAAVEVELVRTGRRANVWLVRKLCVPNG